MRSFVDAKLMLNKSTCFPMIYALNPTFSCEKAHFCGESNNHVNF